MSRSKDEYTDHINRGGDEQCFRTYPAKQKPTIDECIRILTEAGHTVIPSTVETTVS